MRRIRPLRRARAGAPAGLGARMPRRASWPPRASCSTASPPWSNDGVVLQSELDEQVAVMAERLKQQKLELPPQNVLRQQVLERLVLQELADAARQAQPPQGAR